MSESLVDVYKANETWEQALKPGPNGPASSRKWTQVQLAYRLALCGQTSSQVLPQVHASRIKKIYSGLSSISLANNRLMDVNQLALTWVRWPNGEKLALTCVQI